MKVPVRTSKGVSKQDGHNVLLLNFSANIIELSKQGLLNIPWKAREKELGRGTGFVPILTSAVTRTRYEKASLVAVPMVQSQNDKLWKIVG